MLPHKKTNIQTTRSLDDLLLHGHHAENRCAARVEELASVVLLELREDLRQVLLRNEELLGDVVDDLRRQRCQQSADELLRLGRHGAHGNGGI